MSKKLILIPALFASFSLAACAPQQADRTGDIAIEDADLSGIGKADHNSLAFTEIQANIDHDVLVRGGRAIVTSADSFEEYFGTAAPTDVDFSKEWVAFYGVGTRNTGGFGASITSLTLLPEWYGGMIMETKSTSPGSDCMVTMAITWPHTLVKFEAPSYMPDWFSVDSEDETYKCGPDNDDRLAELATSLEEWNTARDANNNSYTYTSEFQSFLGFGARTTIVVKDGAVTERLYKAQHISGGESTQWSEVGSEIGSHPEGASASTIDALYTVCAEEILTQDEDTHWINLFIDSDDGILRNCSASHRLCSDDCSFGPNIATLDF
jgi:hypothetical protein